MIMLLEDKHSPLFVRILRLSNSSLSFSLTFILWMIGPLLEMFGRFPLYRLRPFLYSFKQLLFCCWICPLSFAVFSHPLSVLWLPNCFGHFLSRMFFRFFELVTRLQRGGQMLAPFFRSMSAFSRTIFRWFSYSCSIGNVRLLKRKGIFTSLTNENHLTFDRFVLAFARTIFPSSVMNGVSGCCKNLSTMITLFFYFWHSQPN